MASSAPPILDQLLTPLGECLTPESAEKIIQLRADDDLQNRILELGQKNSVGELTLEEQEEYETVVKFTNFVSILQSKARQILRNTE